MQTQQEQNRFPAKAATDRESSLSIEYRSIFPTALALARWTKGGDIPHVFGTSNNVPKRAAWYAQAQCDFQSWLENGGFHGE